MFKKLAEDALKCETSLARVQRLGELVSLCQKEHVKRAVKTANLQTIVAALKPLKKDVVQTLIGTDEAFRAAVSDEIAKVTDCLQAGVIAAAQAYVEEVNAELGRAVEGCVPQIQLLLSHRCPSSTEQFPKKATKAKSSIKETLATAIAAIASVHAGLQDAEDSGIGKIGMP